jgi:hypothetical protein
LVAGPQDLLVWDIVTCVLLIGYFAILRLFNLKDPMYHLGRKLTGIGFRGAWFLRTLGVAIMLLATIWFLSAGSSSSTPEALRGRPGYPWAMAAVIVGLPMTALFDSILRAMAEPGG